MYQFLHITTLTSEENRVESGKVGGGGGWIGLNLHLKKRECPRSFLSLDGKQ